MFSGGHSASKLSTNLKLAVNRLKLLEKKKTEQALKARKEIADYISNGKDERARIRVEHIIREDYLVEAMELIELYCDLLLARFGLISSTKTVDEGLKEGIASIIWVAPRMWTDIAELKVIKDQLTYKYGKEFAQMCVSDQENWVNERLKMKMSVKAPPKLLVERYLIEIARSHNVPFEPDPSVLSGQDAETLLLDLDDLKPPSGPPSGGSSGGGGGGGMPAGAIPSAPMPSMPMPPQPTPYPPPGLPNPAMAYPPPQQPQTVGFQQPAAALTPSIPAPPYELHDSNPSQVTPGNNPLQPAAPPPANAALPSESIPNLPAVPMSSFPPLDNTVGGKSAGGEDVDFDDLTRRFEELKKKK
ncbi:IST1 homolog [Diadema setosum]|uniref:IST1 homolog n=1 Tax=Diadema setosum TaxID=31175 RepID=UPI003B3A32A3